MKDLPHDPINITSISKTYPNVELTSENEHHLLPGDVLLSWNITGLDGTPCIVAKVISTTKFTLSGIDGSRVDLTVTSGNYKVGEVVSQQSNTVTGIIKTIFYYNEILLHPNDNRVTGTFPFQGEEVFQNDTSGARGDTVLAT